MKHNSIKIQYKDTLFKDGPYKSVKEAISKVARYYPDAPIFGQLDKDKNVVYTTAKQAEEEVIYLGDGLIENGLKDCHIAIVADNGVRYVLADTAISNGVGVVTPVDKDAPDDLTAMLLSKCDADAVITNFYLIDKINRARQRCPRLKTIITIDKKADGCLFYDDIVAEGKALNDANKGIYRDAPLDTSKPAKILFTSGTTGANKGVVLTGANLAANMNNCLDVVKTGKWEDTSMSVLPMHHSTEINTHIMSRWGNARLTYVNTSMKDLMTNIKIFKPSIITVVPMIANAFYNGIIANAKKAGMYDKMRKGIKLSNALSKIGVDVTHKMFKDVFAPFGGNLRQIIVGGAALNPDIVNGFKDLGVFICNGYGITECGPLISMNSDTDKECRSVGRPCPDLQVKIIEADSDGIGALCVKGASVASGYYKDEESTKKVFYPDGFFYTGDLASIDEKGRIVLAGRKKNVIVLSNGKNIYPEEIETEIENNMTYCDDVVVYSVDNGANAILVAGIFVKDDATRADKDKIKADFAALNQRLAGYKRINAVNVAKEPYQRTSTKKIKRDTVLDCHDADNLIKL